MNLPTQHLPKIKISLHIAQATLVVLSLVLTIAVYATSGKTDGRTGYFFALCWATPFILTYQALVPSFPRTRRFCNIYAFAALDGFAVVLWLAAWAAVTDYVVSGKGHGDVKDKTGCENFKYGSANKCKISSVTIILGVIIMLLFVATGLISAKVVLEYQRTGVLPDYMPGASLGMGAAGPLGGAKPTGGRANAIQEDEEAFDSNVNLRNEWEVEEYEHEDYHDRYGGQTHDARQGGYSQAAMDEHDIDDEYADARQQQHHPHNYQSRHPGSRSPLGYPDDHQDLSGQKPTTLGSPLGEDTSYRSSGGGMYGR